MDQPDISTRTNQHMLDILQRIARWMRPAAPVLGILILLLFLLCGGLALFIQSEFGDRLLMSTIAALLWCLYGYVFIQAFDNKVAVPTPDSRGWQRLKQRLTHLWLQLLVFVFIIMTLAVLWLTNRIISEVLS
ncbi:MAG: hypothetical protein N838_21435 [Thiohalocapsa sp. PB-PSB1]|nr:MAG: hypothetical protein N838_22845 [Thiohalocapsa sp. PB-PSB1]QQO55527.1 MAG: hypothetical protein N838_21435 [Thiohalocapsa sp. PB-PSB1]HCS92188.1 hypothetical protein [Chromatiaceae bacterium]